MNRIANPEGSPPEVPGENKIDVSMKDNKDGTVDVTYEFDPPLTAETPETPALKLGRRVIKCIKEATE